MLTVGGERLEVVDSSSSSSSSSNVQCNLVKELKGRIIVLSALAAANAYVRRVRRQAHSPAAAGEQVGMHSCLGRHVPSKVPLPVGDLDPSLLHGSLGPRESASQTVSRSVHTFLHSSSV